MVTARTRMLERAPPTHTYLAAINAHAISFPDINARAITIIFYQARMKILLLQGGGGAIATTDCLQPQGVGGMPPPQQVNCIYSEFSVEVLFNGHWLNVSSGSVVVEMSGVQELVLNIPIVTSTTTTHVK